MPHVVRDICLVWICNTRVTYLFHICVITTWQLSILFRFVVCFRYDVTVGSFSTKCDVDTSANMHQSRDSLQCGVRRKRDMLNCRVIAVVQRDPVLLKKHASLWRVSLYSDFTQNYGFIREMNCCVRARADCVAFHSNYLVEFIIFLQSLLTSTLKTSSFVFHTLRKLLQSCVADCSVIMEGRLSVDYVIDGTAIRPAYVSMTTRNGIFYSYIYVFKCVLACCTKRPAPSRSTFNLWFIRVQAYWNVWYIGILLCVDYKIFPYFYFLRLPIYVLYNFFREAITLKVFDCN